jgi:nucleotide-binding universal stress UspA family protein
MGKKIAQACGSQVMLLHIVNTEVPSFLDISTGANATIGLPLEEIYKGAEVEGQAILDRGKAVFDAQIPIELKIEKVVGDIASGIVEAAEAAQADLIIMGSEGTSKAIKGFLLGSVTNKVLHRTKIPVLVVK